MNRNNTWKFILVLLVLAWSFYEMYPPVGTDLITQFKTQAPAARRDTNYNAILVRLDALEKQRPKAHFTNLLEAIGTNDITTYFPMYDVKGELNATRAVLNRLQKDGAGKIHLGLDLQGGTSFLVEMNMDQLASATNSILSQETRKDDLTQASEVLRKRVDKFGVAEPVIQPEGDNRILIQLPGLSEDIKDEARTAIQKAAFLEFRLVHKDSDELIAQGFSEPGYEILKQKTVRPDGTSQISTNLVKKNPPSLPANISRTLI